jgi:co-chaperonin GroES (HSP10)
MASKVNGKILPLHDKVLVHNMHFGEQFTKTGIFIPGDDGKTHGIHPRWGQVYAVGPAHKEEFNVGDWILVEHGRWSRGIEIEEPSGDKTTIRLIDNNCVMLWDHEKPQDALIGDAA